MRTQSFWISLAVSSLLIAGLACSTNIVPLPPTPTSAPLVIPPLPPITLSSEGQPPPGVGLLPVPSLSLGIEGWQQWQQGGSRVAGRNTVQLMADPTFFKVVEFTRTDGERDGGAAGLYLPLNLDVSNYPHLYVWLVGKVLYEDGGNIANTDPQWFPEGAVQVRLKYLTAKEKEQEWYQGFYIGPVTGADEEHFARVTQGEWFKYTSFDLKSLPEPPWLITEFRIYGFGWEFQGQVAEADIVGSYGP